MRLNHLLVFAFISLLPIVALAVVASITCP
jgi:hypothetical protein